MTPAWTFEHSVECGVPPSIAWAFWTDPANWALDSDVIAVERDGPFAPGTTGRTMTKSSGPIQWRIAEVENRRAVLEFPVEGAVCRFEWTFDPAGDHTHITQRCTLVGPNAQAYAATVSAMLVPGIPQGMQKLASAIESSFSATDEHR